VATRRFETRIRARQASESGTHSCPLVSGRGSQPGGSLVAAFLVASRRAPTTTASLCDPAPSESGARTGAGTCSNARARAQRACLSRADPTTGKEVATPASPGRSSARAAEGEVVHRHNSVTARLARCRSSRGEVTRELVVVLSIGETSGDAGYPAPRESSRRGLGLARSGSPRARPAGRVCVHEALSLVEFDTRSYAR
jgi:hypothetical protein